MKFRLVQRKGRWAVQSAIPMCRLDPCRPTALQWEDRARYRFRFLAALHLLILRERGRKRK